MSLKDQPRKEAEQQVVAIAKDMVAGRLGVIEGSRLLVGMCSKVCGDFDADFRLFVGIDSETDHLPIGFVREHWAAQALVGKDGEIKAAEDCYRESALAACRTLVLRFGGDPITDEQ